MANPPSHFKNGKTGSAITVKMLLKAKKNEIVEILSDGTVKIRLAAAVMDAQANTELINFLAGILEIGAAQIEIVAGAGGSDKLITIMGLDSPTVQERITRQVPPRH